VGGFEFRHLFIDLWINLAGPQPDQSGLGRTRTGYRPIFTGWYPRRVEGQIRARFEKHASALKVKEYRTIGSERGWQTTSVAVVRSWCFASLGIFGEMMTLKIQYHVDTPWWFWGLIYHR
jgi:hypothetical protein